MSGARLEYRGGCHQRRFEVRRAKHNCFLACALFLGAALFFKAAFSGDFFAAGDFKEPACSIQGLPHLEPLCYV